MTDVDNTKRYLNMLYNCLHMPCTKNIHNISYEILGARIEFLPHEHIECVNEDYIKHELEWYKSQDLNIQNHPGIENNKIWQNCATLDGKVNSNYGWCIWSNDNNNQFERAIDAIKNDNMTKQAVMIYSRPTINTEWSDGVHANHDMICTIYTSAILRDGLLYLLVHMRSNDIWYGLRNDLAWQQYVQEEMVRILNDKGVKCECGKIIWNADSLHLYDRNFGEARKLLQEKGYII